MRTAILATATLLLVATISVAGDEEVVPRLRLPASSTGYSPRTWARGMLR